MTRDRDHYVSKATPRAGVPTFVEEEATGKYEGEDLAAARAKRPTYERLARVEKKQDDHAESLRRVELAVERVCGSLEAYVATAKEAHATERVRISSGAKTVGAVLTALAAIAAAYFGASGCS